MTSTATKIETGRAAARAQKKIAVIGCGKMGTILLEAFLESKLITCDEVAATVQHEEKNRALSKGLGAVALGTDNRAAVAKAPVVLLSVKPQVLPQVIDEIAPALAPGALVISIAASTTVGLIQQQLGQDVAVVRAMPNTPAMVGAAMTAVCAGPSAKQEHLETAKRLFEAVGRVLVVDEKHMDAITAVEGLMELEKGGLRVTLMNAVIKTAGRAKELMTS